jgi:hypothetical protein
MAANETKTRLTTAVVDGRPGYATANGLVFAAPLADKKVKAWKQSLRKAGYALDGEEASS